MVVDDQEALRQRIVDHLLEREPSPYDVDRQDPKLDAIAEAKQDELERLNHHCRKIHRTKSQRKDKPSRNKAQRSARKRNR